MHAIFPKTILQTLKKFNIHAQFHTWIKISDTAEDNENGISQYFRYVEIDWIMRCVIIEDLFRFIFCKHILCVISVDFWNIIICHYIFPYSFDVNLGAIPLHVVEEAHREDMVQEISELVHRQLVTSTLGGNFRTTLELTMRVRLQNLLPRQNTWSSVTV